MNATTDIPDVRLHPLWRNTIATMRERGVDYGKTFDAPWLETQLSCERDSMEFALAISKIRRELEADGYYLSGRGQGGNQFVILPPEGNADQMVRYNREAATALKRGVILGTNTRLDKLTESERRRHEALLERMAKRQALMDLSGRRMAVLNDTR